MEVTPIGWLCIVCGLLCSGRPLALAAMAVGTVTFSATAVVNFPAIPFGFQPYHWFGALLVVNVVIAPPREGVAQAFASTGSVLAYFGGFLAWGIVAVLATGAQGTSIAHMAHLWFGASFMVAIGLIAREHKDVVHLVKAFLAGSLFAAAWGIIQLGLFMVGVEYPREIFNNSAGEFAVGFSSTVAGGLLPRVSSVATEPSYLVRSLVPAIPALLIIDSVPPQRSADQMGIHKSPWLWLLLATTLLSTSTLGLFGLAVLVVASVIISRAHRRVALTAATLVGLITWWSAGDGLSSLVLDELTTGKFDVGSGIERATSIEEAAAAFWSHSVIGAGPGLVTSHDVLIKLLSNFGVVGACLFAAALVALQLRAIRAIGTHPEPQWRNTITALASANALLWAMDVVAGVSYQYGVFWALCGLLLAAVNSHERHRRVHDHGSEPSSNGVCDHDCSEWNAAR